MYILYMYTSYCIPNNNLKRTFKTSIYNLRTHIYNWHNVCMHNQGKVYCEGTYNLQQSKKKTMNIIHIISRCWQYWKCSIRFDSTYNWWGTIFGNSACTVLSRVGTAWKPCFQRVASVDKSRPTKRWRRDFPGSVSFRLFPVRFLSMCRYCKFAYSRISKLSTRRSACVRASAVLSTTLWHMPSDKAKQP